MPKGAFYAFPNVKQTGWKAKPLANALLDETGVALIGGPDFGILGEGYLRLSYANSAENILQGAGAAWASSSRPARRPELSCSRRSFSIATACWSTARSIALQVELEMLAEQGLTFERSDYVGRFMGLSTDAYHAAIDEEAQERLGRPIAEAVRQSERLRAVMVARADRSAGRGAGGRGSEPAQGHRQFRLAWAGWSASSSAPACGIISRRMSMPPTMSPTPSRRRTCSCMPPRRWAWRPPIAWCWKTASMG